jgi:ferrous iron transport protein B
MVHAKVLNDTTPAVFATRRLAVVGNPNCGKTTVFNSLTGLRQKVGNYAGVTVEKKEGVLRDPATGAHFTLIDLPGMYSLTPRSPDERIARDILLGRQHDTPLPDGIINVVDASNLPRNLYLTSQLLELGLPVLIVLTMNDVAERRGMKVDVPALSRKLGVPVMPINVRRKQGVSEIPSQISQLQSCCLGSRDLPYDLPPVVRKECLELCTLLKQFYPEQTEARILSEAISLLMSDTVTKEDSDRLAPPVLAHLAQNKQQFDELDLDIPKIIVESRYAWIDEICKSVISKDGIAGKSDNTITDKLDRVLLNKFWGFVIFIGVMALVFQSVFAWAQIPMNWISYGIERLGAVLAVVMPPGDLRDLVIQGVLGGVGTTVTFLPQILILFFFISLLEDTGYLARAAFMMDKVMSKVGLHGKSFIPLLSSFACAIPGIMAARTVDDRKSRLVTILVAPLMSCSARLPVYALMICAFIPSVRVLGVFTLPGITMICMYLLGTFAAFGMAWLFKSTLLRGTSPRFVMELPPYHAPSLKAVGQHMVERSVVFLRRAGTVILTVSIVLWFLASYPKLPGATPQTQMAQSYAGRAGRAIEPAIAPLGFDWRIGVSLVTSFVAREVFVSSMGTIYNVGDSTDSPDKMMPSLQKQLKADHRFSPLMAICVMVYYVMAMQCLSTVAVVRRETNGWKWPIFQVAYMTALAWGVTFIVWHVGRALGF